MTQGYIFLGADDTNETTNIKCAYALSLSLKLLDPTRKTCVIVTKFDDVSKKYERGFDYIIEMPFGRTDINHHDIFIDFWQLFYCTPFTESLFINTYSLVISNIDKLWLHPDNMDLAFATALDFKGNPSTRVKKFMAQERDNIPIFATDVIYFSKNKLSSEFFKMADPVFKNWRQIYCDVLKENSINNFDFTLMVNIVCYLLGQNNIHYPLFDYTDMSLYAIQDLMVENTSWKDRLSLWITNGNTVKINNYIQHGILNYNNYDLITPGVLLDLYDNYIKTAPIFIK